MKSLLNACLLNECRLLLKSRASVLLLAAYFAIAVLALVLGAQRLQQNLDDIEALEERYCQDLNHWRQVVDERGVGSAGYYLFHPVALIPSPWSALFSGEQRENLNLQRVRLLAVHGQIHGSPIINTSGSVHGILDLEFVLLYLLPLLIGLICVTCVSDERRQGRWPLLLSLSSPWRIIGLRIAARFFLTLSLNLLILFLAFLLLSLPLDGIAGQVGLALLGYQVFWFAVSATIIFCFLNARQSILLFVACWLFSAWLLPALMFSQSFTTDNYNTGLALLVKQRQDMNDSWDRDKQADLSAFLEQYPQWQDTAALGHAFDWKWYFAMQKRSDDMVSALAEKYLGAQMLTAGPWQWLSPTLATQYALEDLADTGAYDHAIWLAKVIEWHKESQDFWFPYLFFDKAFPPEKLGEFPLFNQPLGQRPPPCQLEEH